VLEAKHSGKHEIEIWGDGHQTRSFMYIDDCTKGIVDLFESDILEPINLGSSELVTINQLVDIAEEIAGVKLKRKYNLSAPKGVNGRNSDNTLIRKLLGWEPSIRLRDGMEKTMAWIEEQMLSGAPARLTARALPPLSAFTRLASRSTSRLCSWPAWASISPRSAGERLAAWLESGSGLGAGRACRPCDDGCGSPLRRRLGKHFDPGNLLRLKLDVVLPARTQVEPGPPLDLAVVVAADFKAIAQGDALGGPGKRSQGGQGRQSGTANRRIASKLTKNLP
jgi:hypothetical protein